MKQILLILISLIVISAQAQDTVWVNTLHYGSKTRDTLVRFPNGDHNQYEKILMYYSMRCKGGLVSNGTDRNKGCGEWDYSCNTSIVDSSRVDSLKAIHPDYIISGYDNPFLLYTSTPTYTWTQYHLTKTVATNTNSIIKTFPHDPIGDNVLISRHHPKGKFYILYTKEELNKLPQGNISGISLQHRGSGIINMLRVQIAATDWTTLESFDANKVSFSEVVKSRIDFQNNGSTDIYFSKSYNYIDNLSLVFEFTYEGNEIELDDLEILASNTGSSLSLINNQVDKYIQLGGVGRGQVVSQALSQIRDQVTIAFRAKGDANNQPKNNSVFYAVDKQGNRQFNVHLPWSNGKVYWDCGGDNSGYDRIEKNAQPTDYKTNWNHWAFTKNTATGVMNIYLNGNLWYSGTGKTKSITIDKFFLGSANDGGNPYFGSLDDFTVWKKALSAEEVQIIMQQNPATLTHLKSDLLLLFDMNTNTEKSIADLSDFQGKAEFESTIFTTPYRSTDYTKGFELSGIRPDMAFLTGNASIQKTEQIWQDSIENLPYKITPYSVVNRKLQAGDAFYYWDAVPQYVYDENGSVIESIDTESEDVLEIQDLVYYNFYPAKFEIMSFVTPYGIGLNLGLNGKTWIFDVSDFGSILKDDKRLLMDQGGEYQEEIDIQFAFIKGTPARNIIDIQQVWPVRQYDFTSILNNSQLEPRIIHFDNNVQSLKTRVATTGHGQEGEFIPRIHSINIDGGTPEFSWQVWKECADNPVYPQGGTWIYDRAGWCPGAPTDLNEFEITDFVKDKNNFTIDYGINTATGDSRYIVNTQVVKYGSMNFTNDISLEKILSPSDEIAYFRNNPICSNPVIEFKNNGSSTVTEVTFEYGVDNTITNTYTWKGNLPALEKQSIALPDIDVATFNQASSFFANVVRVNSRADEYIQNNKLVSNISPVRNFDTGIIVSMKTNGAPHETRWNLKDAHGNIIKSSPAKMDAFTIYNDTIYNLNGCYQLQFTDSDQDGISWWANSDGTGYIRAKGIKGAWYEFQPDFGSEFTLNFVCGNLVGTDNNSIEESFANIHVYPNITHDISKINMTGMFGNAIISTIDANGRIVRNEEIYLLSGEENTTFIDLENEPAGFYFVKITNRQVVRTFKIIKM